MRRSGFKSSLLAFTAMVVPGMADASELNHFIGFGDSTLDSGYFRYHSIGSTAVDQAIAAAVANGNSGAFVGNGVMNSTLLAARFGLSAAPIGGGNSTSAIGRRTHHHGIEFL